jgi:hypothetical protein
MVSRPRFNSVDAFLGARPHELVYMKVMSEGNLLDKVTFKGEESSVNKIGVPTPRWLINNKLMNQIELFPALGVRILNPFW